MYGHEEARQAQRKLRSKRLFVVYSAKSAMSLIHTRGLIKHFGRRFQLGPIDIQLEPGEVLGVMGPNGAGKTTLLKLIWGFLRPDSGAISVLRLQPHLDQVSVRLHAGYLAETPSFYGWMTTRQHLDFVSGFYDGWDIDRANTLLERFGIDPSVPIRQLSRGNRTKVALVAASGHNPFLLLLDEPTAGLDPIVRIDVLGFLRDLAKNHGVGIVLSSHISDDLDKLADSILMLHDGRAIEYAPAPALVHQYGLGRMEDIFLEAIAKARANGSRLHQKGLAGIP
jgi:ABC-2 type transport system ATP-binding protein